MEKYSIALVNTSKELTWTMNYLNSKLIGTEADQILKADPELIRF